MKIDQRRMVPFFVAGGILAGCFGAIKVANDTFDIFAAKRNAKIGGKIINAPDEVKGAFTDNIEVTIDTLERVYEGDHVEFCTVGLGSIPAKDITIQSTGEIVGRLAASSTNNPRNTQMSYSTPKSEREKIAPGGQERCYKITFNSNAEKYPTIDGISITNSAYSQFVLTDRDYESTLSITDNDGKVVDSKKVLVKATSTTEYKVYSTNAGGTGAWNNNDGVVTGLINPRICIPGSKTIGAGDVVTYDISGSGVEYTNLMAGSTIEMRRSSFQVFGGDYVNGDGVWVFEDLETPYRFEVVEHAKDKLVLKALDEISGGESGRCVALTGNGFSVKVVDDSALTDDKKVRVAHKVSITSDSNSGGTILGPTTVNSTINYQGSKITPGDGTYSKGSVVARYYDESGNEIHDPKDVKKDAVYGESYSDKEIEITGYTFKKLADDSAQKTGTVKAGTQIIKYIYARKTGSVIAKYEDESGNPIANQKTVKNNAPYGEAYSDTEAQIDGYDFKQLKSGSAPQKGTVNDTTQTITYVYTRKKGSVYVRHIDKDTGKDIVPQDTLVDNKTYGTKYDAKPRVFENYNAGRLKSGVTPGDVHLPSLTIVYEYEIKRGSVIAKYVDENGKEIAPQKSVKKDAPYGEDYNDSEIQITGYTFKGVGSGAQKTGKVNDTTQTITYQYVQQRGSIIVKIVDKEGNVLRETKIEDNQPYGKDYTAKNDFSRPGYRYVGMGDGSASEVGKVNNGTQTVIYQFEKIPLTQTPQTVKVGDTPDPKDHLPEELLKEFESCDIRYKDAPDTSKPGIVDVTIIVDCKDQEPREIDSKVYVLGGDDITIKVGDTPDPKSHIPDFDEKFPGCTVRYKEEYDTTKAGTIDATIIIECEGEEPKEVDVKIHVNPVPTNPQTVKVGDKPKAEDHIPDFDKTFPGCSARYKTEPDTSKAGRVDVVIIVTCGDKEIELFSHLIIEDEPKIEIDAPHTGSESSIFPAVVAALSTLATMTGVFVAKRK